MCNTPSMMTGDQLLLGLVLPHHTRHQIDEALNPVSEQQGLITACDEHPRRLLLDTDKATTMMAW